MSETVGYAIRGGFTREASVTTPTWPATTAALVTTLLPLLSGGFNDGVNKKGVADATSGLAPVAFDIQDITPSLSLPLQLRYHGLESLWGCALGYGAKRISTTLNPETLATGVYRHSYEVDPNVSDFPWQLGDGFHLGANELSLGQRRITHGTMALDMVSEVWELKSSMVAGMSLTASHQGCFLSFDFLAHSKSASSSVNTATTLRNALPNYAPRAHFHEAVWRIAPYSASVPLGSGDSLKITAWSLRLDPQIKSTYGPRTGTAPELLFRTTAPTITVQFTIERHQSEAWQTRWRANTTIMADMKWTGALIGGSGINSQCNLFFPSLKVIGAQLSPNGASTYTETVQAIAIVPSAAAAGFPTFHNVTPFGVQLVTTTSQHGLGV